jgi:hypothetical protein
LWHKAPLCAEHPTVTKLELRKNDPTVWALSMMHHTSAPAG